MEKLEELKEKCWHLRDWGDLWKNLSDNVESWERTTDQGFRSMKLVMDIEADMRDLLYVVNNNARFRAIYDPSFHSGHVTLKLGDRYCISYTRVKKVSFVSGREFLVFTYWHVDDEGRVYIVCFWDEEAEGLEPVNPELVRGHVPCGGWIFEPYVGQKEGVIKLIYFVETDFAGNIPNFLLTPAFKDNAKKMLRIRDLCKQVKEERLSGKQ
jgi:hypothetical protein